MKTLVDLEALVKLDAINLGRVFWDSDWVNIKKIATAYDLVHDAEADVYIQTAEELGITAYRWCDITAKGSGETGFVCLSYEEVEKQVLWRVHEQKRIGLNE
jgi:hypothetical protein